MAVKLYMDVHVRRAVTVGLRLRGVDVLTAQEDGSAELEDRELLARATFLGRALFSQDTDFLAIANSMQISGEPFSGVVFAHQLKVSVGRCVEDLSIIALATEPDEWQGQIAYLPL